MTVSDDTRLSVLVIDVQPGHEDEFYAVEAQLKQLLESKNYARVNTIRDEVIASRFFTVRQWTSAQAARFSHGDPAMNGLRTKLYEIAIVTYVVNGVQGLDAGSDDRRVQLGERDRRAGFDRRMADHGRSGGDRRRADRRIGPRRARERAGDLVAAARRARENADARFSNFKVGAALETADGDVITGCNVENATYGLTICAERVAMFKALSDGHRAFTRIAIVADTAVPTPPCGACRQILWEFGGNLEVTLGNLHGENGTYRLKDLLPLPFDARLLQH